MFLHVFCSAGVVSLNLFPLIVTFKFRANFLGVPRKDWESYFSGEVITFGFVVESLWGLYWQFL